MAAKCFVRTFFRLDLNLAKRAIDDLLCDRLLKLVKIKVYVRRLNSCISAKPQLLQKSFVKNCKTENIFLHNSIKISGNFNIKHL